MNALEAQAAQFMKAQQLAQFLRGFIKALHIALGALVLYANIIAGYSMAYRRPFKIGDLVKVDDTVGEVINYSTLGKQQGLILHTTVGIGYETPWRQVDAMLNLAAARTPGLLQEPDEGFALTGNKGQ